MALFEIVTEPNENSIENLSGESRTGNVVAASDVAVAKASEKRGRGRPKGSGTKNKESVQKSLPSSQVAPDLFTAEEASKVAEIDTTFIVAAADGALTAADIFIAESYRSKAEDIAGADPDKFVKKVSLGEVRKKTLLLGVEGVARKYPILTTYAPELSLVLGMMSWGISIVIASRELKALAKNEKNTKIADKNESAS